MKENDLIKRIAIARAKPDNLDDLKPSELAELVLIVLEYAKQINKDIQEGKIKGENGESAYNPQPDVDYLSLPTAKKELNNLLNQAIAKVDSDVKNALSRVKNGKDGKDAQITQEQLKEAAKLAFEMIQLPDFRIFITEQPEAIRDSLELLRDDERLDASAIKGLDELFKKNAPKPELMVGGIRFLSQLADVRTTSLANGDVLIWNSTTKVWENGAQTGGGGGGTPGGSDTQIQFNNGGSFGGTKLEYTEPGGDTLQITVQAQSVADTNGYLLDFEGGRGLGSGSGGDLILNAGNPGITGNGGNVYVGALSGGATSGDGGSVQIEGGNSVVGTGGTVEVEGGDSANGDGGWVNFIPGSATGSGNTGGTVSFSAGTGISGADAGNIQFQPGNNSGDGGANGVIKFKNVVGSAAGIVDFESLTVNRTYTFPDQSGTIALLSDIGAGGGISRTIVTTSGNVTAGATADTDYTYYVAGAHTISMPSPNDNRYTIKNLHSAAITIDTVGAENIEGAASLSLQPNDSVDIMSDGTNWYVH